MAKIEDPYWIAIDDLSDHPRIWAICDRCDAEALITTADVSVCPSYKTFAEQHQSCSERRKT